MNNNDFEIILDLATSGERYSAEEFAATRAAEGEIAARLTLITAEALLADGWNCIYASRDDYWEPLKISDDGNVVTLAELRLYHTHAIDMHVRGNWVQTNGKTMYDLRELVRLLGGAK